ncbi:MAG: hypothetical protein A2020_04200 [Lentisphaerae bacterium GWF2_45_14]|nr:MAG: hypothetical protein A2020_04200 [Lentisphaerae bacterium GWF2_45_14]
MKNYELGFYVVPEPEKMRRQINVLSGMGIRYIGTDGFCGWEDNAFTEKIAEIIGKSEMKLHSFHSPFGLMFPRLENLDRSLSDNYRIIDVARSWGAKNIVWHMRWFRRYEHDTHFASVNVMDEMGQERIDELMSQVLPGTCAYAARYGININLENMPLFSWDRDCDNILGFIRNQGLKNLGFIYDIGHAWCSGIDPASPILNSGHLLKDTHFHDNYGVLDYDLNRVATIADISKYDLHLPVGLGTINWLHVIRALRQINYSSPIIFEGTHMKGHPEEASIEQYCRSVRLTIDNWRASEELAEYLKI